MREALGATPKTARPSTTRAGASLTSGDVARLRAAAGRYGPGAEDAKAEALAGVAALGPRDARALIALHDALLFMVAYPGSVATRDRAAKALAGAARAACAIARDGSPRQRRRLEGSGIAGCEVTAAFSHPLCEWLARSHGARAEVTGFGDDRRVAEVLALCLPRMESELLAAADDDALALIDDAKGEGGTRLGTLLALLRAARASRPVREHLFESMQPFVTLRPAMSALSRTFARRPCEAPYVHEQALQRRLDDPLAAIREPLPPPAPLTPRERRALLDVARASLAMLSRETDPLTWPSVDAIAHYDLGRGASVALYPMHPARRFALDSHTGYLLLKNGVPVGYGGGWPFLATCRHGANVFEAFRGGESAWLYARVLAAYRRHFGVKRFVVEPYQFGAGNREGLMSGAFWFYYRLGFRPVERAVAKIARTEFGRLARPGYRPPVATMRALTASDLALDVEPSSAAERCEPAEISLAVSRWIASAHRGDRAAAMRDATSRVGKALGVRGSARWPRDERESFASLALAFASIPDLAAWDERDKAACVELMRAKGRADDAPYFRALAAHPRLAAALAKVASAAG